MLNASEMGHRQSYTSGEIGRFLVAPSRLGVKITVNAECPARLGPSPSISTLPRIPAERRPIVLRRVDAAPDVQTGDERPTSS